MPLKYLSKYTRERIYLKGKRDHELYQSISLLCKIDAIKTYRNWVLFRTKKDYRKIYLEEKEEWDDIGKNQLEKFYWGIHILKKIGLKNIKEEEVVHLNNFRFQHGLDFYQELFQTKVSSSSSLAKQLRCILKRWLNLTIDRSYIYHPPNELSLFKLDHGDIDSLYQKLDLISFLIKKVEKPTKIKTSQAELDWLESISREQQIKLEYQHQIGRYHVDGYHPASKSVFEYHGCFWHGHDCKIGKGGPGDKRYQKTIEKMQKLTEMGYTVIYKWECEAMTRTYASN